ncbi:protein timeless homolog isoform X2 [Homalodisca vitripennis]|uniref:protein timeless homolog isoform X2 n=1 Tax=Homalodisca vitripennis TaxID=197043 RepID=UPI001EEAD5F8|nr:protein timeless homolog isoform X2 [Homalodisca vitripennis]
MLSGLLSAELSATCNALGYSSGSTYYTDPYVKETITDLIRYLRRDDEDHTIRRHLGSAKILQTDLLPILIHHSEKEDLFDVLLRLLVNLTNPALLIYQEQLPTERTASHHFLQLVAQLQGYKEAFTDQQLWEILAKKLADLLQIEYHERDEDQSRTMERILILARNVLQVPTDADENRPDNDASIHDQVLWALHQGGMVDLFLYIASTDHEQQYYMHILEIVSLMLREQNPATLASAALQRSQQEKERDEKELLEIRRREIKEKQAKVKLYTGSRHSRFGGTFIIKNFKSISDRDLIYHKPPTKGVTFSVGNEKERSKVPKNKQALTHHTSERRSAFSVRLFLKEFCVEFLNGAYNPLMYKVRENLVRAVGQPNDETYYFWAMKFFMEFNRLYKFQVKLISETMHQQIFHFVQTQMENWLENMIVDKKKIPLWSRRIHQALKAYQELLLTLQAMDRSPDQSVRESARVIKSNIFYQSEYRELIIYLFNVFTETKFTRSYLKDLVETAHIFLKMLEHFCSRHQNLIVQGKAKKRNQKKKKKSTPKTSAATTQNLEAIWDQVGPELSAVLQGQAEIPSDLTPFDAASDLTMDQQKVEAMKRIQLELKQGNFEQAVGLLRASREIWPENDSFGHTNMAPDEEFLAMREIFMTDIGLPAESAIENGNNEEESEDEEEDPRDIVVPEQTFKFMDFVGRFASPRVLAPVCLLLEHFEKNSHHTNHCAVKILHRVAWDCKMPALLFQASLFRTFQRIFQSSVPEHKELVKFAVFIMRKFTEMAKKNKKIFMEILFWKSKKEEEELENGYGNVKSKSHSAKNVWQEEQEDELRRLAAEYERDTPEPDAVAWIMKNMIDQTRSRKAVIKKLKELYLVVGNIKPKPVSNTVEFSEEEIAELRSLFEQYKNAQDPMTCILGRLSTPRSRKTVLNKMLELEIITNKKEVYKKKAKGESKKRKDKSEKEKLWGQRSDDESIYDSWSDDDGDSTHKSRTTKKAQRTLVQPSLAQMCCNLQRVADAEMQEALEWLKVSLQEVLDDLDDNGDDEEGIALLPLTASCIQAMDNPTFLQLLDILSIDKPTDQETYWRIPGRWKAADLTRRIGLIKDALEGTLPNVNPDVEEQVKFPGIPRATQESPSGKKKKLTKKRPKKITREDGNEISRNSFNDSSSDSDDEKSDRKHVYSQSRSDKHLQSGRRQSVEGSHSEDESVKSSEGRNEDLISDKENTDGNTSINVPRKNCQVSSKGNSNNRRNKLIINSDSENDEMIVTSTQKSDIHRENNISSSRVSDSSDSETYSRTLNSIRNSTASSNTSESRIDSKSLRRKKAIESDSDEDRNTVNSSKSRLSSPNEKSTKSHQKAVKRKRLSIDSDSDDENSIKSLVVSPSEHGKKSLNKSSGKKKKRTIQSDSDDGHSTSNSTKTSVVTLSQQSTKSRSESFVKNRSDSGSDSEDGNSTLNSTKTSVAISNQQSIKSQSANSIKVTTHNSDSEDGNSTKTSVVTSSQQSTKSRSESFVKNRSNSDSEDENSTLNSTKTSVAISSQRSSITQDGIVNERKRSSIESDSENEKNFTLASTKSEISLPSPQHNTIVKRKRISVESDSDEGSNTAIDFPNSLEIPENGATNGQITSESEEENCETKSDIINTNKSVVVVNKEHSVKRKRLKIDSDSD